VRLSLAEIRRRHVVDARPLDASTAAALNADPRPGAKAILAAIDRRHFANRSEGQRLRKLLRYECALWQTGIMHVAGVDEAGMSPLAGPVAAAAVIFAPGSRIPGVEIKGAAVAWSVAFVEVEEIDSPIGPRRKRLAHKAVGSVTPKTCIDCPIRRPQGSRHRSTHWWSASCRSLP